MSMITKMQYTINNQTVFAEANPWALVNNGSGEQLARFYTFIGLFGPTSKTSLRLFFRLHVTETMGWFSAKKTAQNDTSVVIIPAITQQTVFTPALFGLASDLAAYKVLTVRLDSREAGTLFTFDQEDQNHLLNLLLLGDDLTLRLIETGAPPRFSFHLYNDPSFREAYLSYRKRLGVG